MDGARRLVAMLVVGLVVLAGCSAGSQDTPSPGPVVDDTPTATPTASGPTPTATPTAPDGPPYEPPLNASEVLRAHEYAVLTGGSYSFRTALRVREPSSNWTLHDVWTVQAALMDGPMYLTRDSSVSTNHRIYVNATGTGYEPAIINGKESFKRPRASLTDPRRFITPSLEPFIRGIDFTADGTITRDGQTVYVYSATDKSQFAPGLLNLRYYRNGSIRNASARLLIAESGTILAFDYRVNGTDLEGDTIIYRAPFAYDDVGRTDVPEPPWLEEARDVLDD
jgi:hypothetical protein